MVERGRDDSMTTLLSHDNQQDLEIHGDAQSQYV